MIRPSIEPAEAGEPRVAVVLLTHNRCAELMRTLEQLAALPERPEIIVVDNASTDGTAEAVRGRFPAARYLRLDRNIGAAARNLGVRRSQRPFVAFCDDDIWWAPGSLRRAVELFDRHPTVATMTARVLVGPEERLDPTCEVLARSPFGGPERLPGPAVLGFLAGATVVRREAFLQAGGFDERFFIGGEEELLALDLVSRGWDLVYVSELVAHHYPSRYRDLPRRQRTQLRNRLWTVWLRRPLRRVAVRTLAALKQALSDQTARSALAEALRELPSILADRRVIPERVERQLAILEKSRAR